MDAPEIMVTSSPPRQDRSKLLDASHVSSSSAEIVEPKPREHTAQFELRPVPVTMKGFETRGEHDTSLSIEPSVFDSSKTPRSGSPPGASTASNTVPESPTVTGRRASYGMVSRIMAPSISSAGGHTDLPSDIKEGLLETYWLMKKRWWERVTRGATGGRLPSFNVGWIFGYALADMIFAIIEMQRRRLEWMELSILIMLSVFFASMSPRHDWLGRVIIIEVFAWVFLFFILDVYRDENLFAGILISSILAVFVVSTVVFFLVYPYLIRQYVIRLLSGTKGPVVIDANLPPDERSYEFEERSLGGFWYICPQYFPPPVHKVVYKGALHNGKPHGIGTWIDGNYRGEHLVGYWQDGIPVGPFESEEGDTGTLFSNLRIIFATNARGIKKRNLRFGVASVECPLSGAYPNGYPLVHYIQPPAQCSCTSYGRCTCVTKVLENMNYRHLNEMIAAERIVIGIDRLNESLSVSGHESRKKRPLEATVTLNKSERGLSLSVNDSWTPTQSAEGLLFLHGLSHSLHDALCRFGQLLAMGHFPPHIKPFLYHWPAGENIYGYICATHVTAETSVHHDLRRYIQSLAQSGIRQLHVVVHSMGTRLFLRSFAALKDLFVLRFPDVDEDGTIDTSREADDSGDDRFGNLETDSATSRSSAQKPTITLLNLILINPDYDLETFRDTDFGLLRKYCDCISLYADNRDMAIRFARSLHSLFLCSAAGAGTNLGHCVRPLKSRRTGRYLDMDVIDTSDLENNMSTHHHSYFNVNRNFVDDVRDAIVNRVRAHDRSRLMQRGGYYRFIILPPQVLLV